MNGIVAMDLNRLIGNHGKIPWKLSSDMKFFKKMTSNKDTGGFLIMGRKTFDDVGVLPNRHSYVLTNDVEKLKNKNSIGYEYVTESGLMELAKPDHRFWVCGGSEIYRKYLPLCENVYVTIVLDEYEGDCYLSDFEHHFPTQTLIAEEKTHFIVKYSK